MDPDLWQIIYDRLAPYLEQNQVQALAIYNSDDPVVTAFQMAAAGQTIAREVVHGLTPPEAPDTSE